MTGIGLFTAVRTDLTLISANRPAPHYSCFSGPSARCQRFGDVHVATKTDEVASLTPREERVLRMRFGIGMNTDHTLEEVGQQFSVTRERIRQIEAKALRKLKHPSRSRKMRSFLDQ